MWYGPDTYMGENLHTLLSRLAAMTDEQVAAVHPQHTAATIRDLLPRFQYFKQVCVVCGVLWPWRMAYDAFILSSTINQPKQGNCIVHHMFGHDVVQRVKAHYGDAFHTAHLEVRQ